MENRRAISRTLPGLYRTTPVQRLGPFFRFAQFEAGTSQNNFAPMFDVSCVRTLEWE